MKKILMGVVAVLATSFAIPAFADDAPAAGGDKPAKAKKGGKKAKKDKKDDAAPAK